MKSEVFFIEAIKGLQINSEEFKVFFQTNGDSLWCHLSFLRTICDINSIFCRVLMDIGARALSTHIRVFADFLVYQVSTAVAGEQVNVVSFAINPLADGFSICLLKLASLDSTYFIALKKGKLLLFIVDKL